MCAVVATRRRAGGGSVSCTAVNRHGKSTKETELRVKSMLILFVPPTTYMIGPQGVKIFFSSWEQTIMRQEFPVNINRQNSLFKRIDFD